MNIQSTIQWKLWFWMDSFGKVQLKGTRSIIRCESALHVEVEALQWAIENIQHSTCQNFGTGCMELIAVIKEAHAWPSFTTELERI